jgi:hypothetical protein
VVVRILLAQKDRRIEVERLAFGRIDLPAQTDTNALQARRRLFEVDAVAGFERGRHGYSFMNVMGQVVITARRALTPTRSA